jgi:hypothetical protein
MVVPSLPAFSLSTWPYQTSVRRESSFAAILLTAKKPIDSFSGNNAHRNNGSPATVLEQEKGCHGPLE